MLAIDEAWFGFLYSRYTARPLTALALNGNILTCVIADIGPICDRAREANLGLRKHWIFKVLSVSELKIPIDQTESHATVGCI